MRRARPRPCVWWRWPHGRGVGRIIAGSLRTAGVFNPFRRQRMCLRGKSPRLHGDAADRVWVLRAQVARPSAAQARGNPLLKVEARAAKGSGKQIQVRYKGLLWPAGELGVKKPGGAAQRRRHHRRARAPAAAHCKTSCLLPLCVFTLYSDGIVCRWTWTSPWAWCWSRASRRWAG